MTVPSELLAVRAVRQMPRRVELPAGSYRVSCQNPDLNVSSNFTVTIRAGQQTRELNHPLN